MEFELTLGGGLDMGPSPYWRGRGYSKQWRFGLEFANNRHYSTSDNHGWNRWRDMLTRNNRRRW